MRVERIIQRIWIVGSLWMGRTGATTRDLTPAELERIPDPSKREDVWEWVGKNCGDFATIQDIAFDFTLGSARNSTDIEHDFVDSENWSHFSEGSPW